MFSRCFEHPGADYNWLMRAQIGYLKTFWSSSPHKIEGLVDGQRHWKRPSVADIRSTCGIKWPCRRCTRVNFFISMSDITLEVDHLTCPFASSPSKCGFKVQTTLRYGRLGVPGHYSSLRRNGWCQVFRGHNSQSCLKES